MKLNLVAALLAGLATQTAEGDTSVAEFQNIDLQAATAELTAYHAQLPPETLPPALKVWTVVQVNADVQAVGGKVGVVCGGNGDELNIDFQDGQTFATLDKSKVKKLT
jgi:hypothetical protein